MKNIYKTLALSLLLCCGEVTPSWSSDDESGIDEEHTINNSFNNSSQEEEDINEAIKDFVTLEEKILNINGEIDEITRKIEEYTQILELKTQEKEKLIKNRAKYILTTAPSKKQKIQKEREELVKKLYLIRDIAKKNISKDASKNLEIDNKNLSEEVKNIEKNLEQLDQQEKALDHIIEIAEGKDHYNELLEDDLEESLKENMKNNPHLKKYNE